MKWLKSNRKCGISLLTTFLEKYTLHILNKKDHSIIYKITHLFLTPEILENGTLSIKEERKK